MKIKLTLIFSIFVVTIQWLTVVSFIDRAYSSWLKMGDRTVSSSIGGVIFFAACSLLCIAYLMRLNDELQKAGSSWRHISQASLLMGMAGLLVFFGMIGTAIVVLR
ncbi:hypothetical protein [Herbaspirillum robiniae]|uniref:Uncharacterized protein n=1 Tax=Herbaspirillum robiniae TaxID=2014887 RepID=A0ABX2M2Q2_9BURK|nr:hypothetical protein [Herbaspirillum robiniae]NUU01976.1 hypothetical protein [Herbaspirillum robiniae]